MKDRERVRIALAKEANLTSGQVSLRTGLDYQKVSRHLSAMFKRTQEVVKTKTQGEYATYALASPLGLACQVTDIGLKLAQLRSLKPALLKAGLSLVNEIIRDYESLK